MVNTSTTLPRDTEAPTSLKARRQSAIAAAEQCMQILKQELGAREVIVFGSLRGDGPWHWESDLDLAIRGLSSKAFGKAYLRLEKVVPSWLKFDLVDLDNVLPYVRDRILNLTPMPQNLYLALKMRIESEIASIEHALARLTALLSQAESIPEIALTPALASYISDFYNGCERICQRVAVVLDESLPQGKDWHQDLLNPMAQPGGQDRPPLWPEALYQRLDGYRSFRHVERHRYNFELELDRVLELAHAIPALFGEIQTAIGQFNHWLDQQALTESS